MAMDILDWGQVTPEAYDKHLPGKPAHIVKVDIRGQDISAENCELLISHLKGRYSRTDSLESREACK